MTSELKLLKHQYELCTDTDTKVLGLVSGFGGGKTFAVCRKAVLLALANAGYDGIITEPNHPLLTQILIPEMKAALDQFGIAYKFNKAEYIFYCTIDGKETRIICKALENYERLIGINAAWIICDEFDTTKQETAYAAYIKLLGRIRVGNVKQMVIVSTPEGFKAMHQIFIKEASNNTKLIKAKTTDNKHLPNDYIQLLYDTYPEQLIASYINGDFVNLTSGAVYTEFNRATHNSTETIQPNEPLHIGLDFNVNHMAGVVHVLRDGKPHAVDELVGYLDTPAMVAAIKQRYPDHRIMVYPDASGKSRKTVNASESDIALLKQAGFIVMAHKSNPYIKDRVLAVNVLFKKCSYYVNIDKCPELVEGFEQQAYDKNGQPDKTSGHDHVIDGAGYFIAYKFPIAKVTIDKIKIKGF